MVEHPKKGGARREILAGKGTASSVRGSAAAAQVPGYFPGLFIFALIVAMLKLIAAVRGVNECTLAQLTEVGLTFEQGEQR